MVKKAAKPKTYKGKSLKPGGGGQAAKLHDALAKKGLPAAEIGGIIHNQGVKKYGKAKFAKMAAAGKKRASKKKGGK